MDNLARWIILLSCIPVFATAAYACVYFRRLDEKLRVFSWFLFLSGIVQLVSVILWWFRYNNMPLLHLYVAAGFVCLAWFYKTVLRDFIDRRVINAIIGVFLVFTFINSLFFQSVLTFNSYALTLEAVFIIIFSLSTFILSKHEILKDVNLSTFRSINWINAGLFLFYTSDILLFYFGDAITDYFPAYMNRYTWVAHSFFSVIMYSCFFIGLWRSQKN